ncbi:MAG TPA: hypothetical protein VKM36_03615, partial [Balneolaceae bacterium]|nr:hypothetical protein [Balneolaceae bacterium]
TLVLFTQAWQNLFAFFAWVFSPRALRETRGKISVLGFTRRPPGSKDRREAYISSLYTGLAKSLRVLCVAIFSARFA